MGTRSITTIRSRWEHGDWGTHAVIYRHWDGYLSGHGKFLADFLERLHVVNGVRDDDVRQIANGPGRLASQLVTKLQIEGHDPDLMPCVRPCGQEYHYQIDVLYGQNGGDISVSVFDGPVTAFGAGGESCNNLVFNGAVSEFCRFIKSKSDS